MQVLLVNQFFWPDTAATGQLLTDVTREIDSELHRVTVLCGRSVYGEVDAASPPPVRIVQCGSVAFSRGKIGRVVSYASFFAGAAVRGVWGPKPELVLTLTTPPLVSLLGTLLKSLRGSQHYIWEMDLYPDIAVDLNVMKARSVVTRLIGTVADFSRKRADGIIALGDDMKARLVARGIPEHKILVAENWADGREIVPAPFEEGPLKKPGIKKWFSRRPVQGSKGWMKQATLADMSEGIQRGGVPVSYGAGLAMIMVFNAAGRPATLYDAAELQYFGEISANAAVVMLSRSGKSGGPQRGHRCCSARKSAKPCCCLAMKRRSRSGAP